MEQITAHPYEQVTSEVAALITLPDAARQTLPGAELTVEVTGKPGDQASQPSSKRIGIRLRWRDRSGQWDAPVRLTSWVAARRKE